LCQSQEDLTLFSSEKHVTKVLDNELYIESIELPGVVVHVKSGYLFDMNSLVNNTEVGSMVRFCLTVTC